ncbi:hypothetical protein ACLB2K_039123 [Fragaria x ananassa]
MEPPAPKKDWFLYLMMENLICRLNIDELCNWNSPKPQTSDNDSDDDDSGDGEINNPEDDADNRERRRRDNSRVPNLDVFAFDPNASDGPTISLSDGRTIPRRIIDPRLIDPIVFTLEDKIYVMARAPYLGNEEDIDHQPPLFKVFDPLHQFWKELPTPPHCDYGKEACYFYCTWGHKLLVHHNQRRHLFDTHHEKWEDLPREEGDELLFDTAAVEFEGFLIVSNIPAVPPVILALVKYAKQARCDLSSLRRISSGAAPLSKEVVDEFRQKFPWVELRPGYGLTESCGATTFFISDEEAKKHTGSCGHLVPKFAAKVVDIETGQALGPYKEGELWLKSPTIMKEYLGNVEATIATIDEEGWLKTGDLCYFSKGLRLGEALAL